jgi:acetylornithine deacetylase/succinyl-diaminopimelate desuccinylase-like protein
LSTIDKRIETELDNLISQLQGLIKIPSVSAKNQSLDECAILVSTILNNAGIKSELLYLNEEGKTDKKKSVPPIVFGQLNSKSNPSGKTIMFYNHYDVQPPEPLELWEADPFSGKREGNYVYGRGSSDDKGELLTRIKAVEYILKETGDVPCNIKFVVEGEEEIGSCHIEEYLTKYRDRLRCDGVIWEFGYVDEKDRPIISLGMKGLLFVEMIARGPNADVHSSLAAVIENPAWRLVYALSTLRDQSGKILIQDWYKDIRDFTTQELKLIKQENFDEEDFKRNYGIQKFVINDNLEEIKKALVGGPTCNIAGLYAGYIGEGTKTVLPSVAKAKFDFRLVPDMNPKKQFELLRKHLDKHGFTDIEITFVEGEPASRTPVDHKFVKLVEQCAIEEYGEAIISVSSAGTGPMSYFAEILNAPCVSVGSTYKYSRIHSPNEFTRIDLLQKTIKCIGRVIDKFGGP